MHFMRNQLANVAWRDATSKYSLTESSVRQGGIPSPFLFKFYIGSVIDSISLVKESCILSISKINILAYADDLVLLSSSLPEMEKLYQKLFSDISKYSLQIDKLKTKCRILVTCKRAVSTDGGNVILGEDALEIIDSYKYLDHVTEENLSNVKDIELRMSKFYATANSISRN